MASYFVLQLHLTSYTVVWAVLTCLGFGVAIFIRVGIEETMETAKAWRGWGVFCRTLRPGSTKSDRAARAEGHDDGGGYGFALFCSGPDGAAAVQADPEGARARRRALWVVLAATWLAGIAASPEAMQTNYMLGSMHIKQEKCAASDPSVSRDAN